MIFVIADDGLRADPKLNGFVNGKEFSSWGRLLRPRQRSIQCLLNRSLEAFLFKALFSAVTITSEIDLSEITTLMCRVKSVGARASDVATFIGHFAFGL